MLCFVMSHIYFKDCRNYHIYPYKYCALRLIISSLLYFSVWIMNQGCELLCAFLNKLRCLIESIFILENYRLIYHVFLESLSTATNDPENLVLPDLFIYWGIAIYKRDHRFFKSCLNMKSNIKYLSLEISALPFHAHTFEIFTHSCLQKPT